MAFYQLFQNSRFEDRLFPAGKYFQGGNKSQQIDNPNIIQGVNPMESWKMVEKLGDGAFGKVFKVSLKS